MKKAFTLIELLVVIAIIAILAAILFPVFAQAKAAAKKTAALSNVKQLGTGVMLYMGDSDDVYPIGVGWDEKANTGAWAPTYGGWARDTSPYIKSIGIFRDASDSLAVPSDPAWLATSIKNNDAQMISLVANGYTNWSWETGKNELMGLMGYASSKAGMQVSMFSQNATGFAHAADTIMLCERFGSNNSWGTDAVLIGHPYDDAYYTQAGNIPDNDPSSRPNGPYNKTGVNAHLVDKDAHFGAVSHPYGNLGVFAFADGHAKTMDPRQTNPSTYGQKDKNLWDALRP